MAGLNARMPRKSVVPLIALPRAKIRWSRIFSKEKEVNPTDPQQNQKQQQQQVSVFLITDSTLKPTLHYFSLSLKDGGQQRNLKLEESLTQEFGQNNLILHVDWIAQHKKFLIVVKETEGLVFYGLPSSSSSLSSSLSSSAWNRLVKLSTDRQFHSLFFPLNSQRTFSDLLAFGNILLHPEKQKAVLGALFHNPVDNSTSVYEVDTGMIFQNEEGEEEEEQLNFNSMIQAQLHLPEEIQGQPLTKIWIKPLIKSQRPNERINCSSGSLKPKVDVVVIQAGSDLILYQLDIDLVQSSTTLVKIGKVTLPFNSKEFNEMKDRDSKTTVTTKKTKMDMNVKSLEIFSTPCDSLGSFQISALVTFESVTVLYAPDPNGPSENLTLTASDFYYLDKIKNEVPVPIPNVTGQSMLLDGPLKLDLQPKINNSSRQSIQTTSNRNAVSVRQTNRNQNSNGFLNVMNLSGTPNQTQVLLYEENGHIKITPILPLSSNSSSSSIENLEKSLSFPLPQRIQNQLEEMAQEIDFDNDTKSGPRLKIERDWSLKSESHLPDRPILDSISLQDISTSVHQPSGQVQLNLPLIPEASISLQYLSNTEKIAGAHKQKEDNELLGHPDWKITLRQHPHIIRVRRDFFEDEDDFYLVFNGQPNLLVPENQSPTSVKRFSMEKEAEERIGQEFTKVEYHEEEEFWEVEWEGVTAFLGQENMANAVKFRPIDRNWAIQGGKTKLGFEWHVNRLQNHGNGKTFNYKYIQSKSQDSEVFLSSITTVHSNTKNTLSSIELHYGKNSESDCDSKLAGYTWTTPNFKQDIQFEYQQINVQFPFSSSPKRMRMLSGIRQNFEGVGWRDMIRFSYTTMTPSTSTSKLWNSLKKQQNQNVWGIPQLLLSSVEFPLRKSKVSFAFQEIDQFPTLKHKMPPRPEKIFQLENSHGNDDIVAVAHSFLGHSVLAQKNSIQFYKQADGSVSSIPVRVRDSGQNNGPILKLSLIAKDFCIFLTIKREREATIQVYCNDRDRMGHFVGWKFIDEKVISVPSKTFEIIHDGANSFFTLDNENPSTDIWLHSFDTLPVVEKGPSETKTKREWESALLHNGRTASILPFSFKLEASMATWTEGQSNNTLVKFMRNKKATDSRWNVENIKSVQLGYREECSSFFSNIFDMDSKAINSIRDYFQPRRVSFSKNLYFLTSCSLAEDGWTIQQVVDLVVIGFNGNLASHKTFYIPQENLENVREERSGGEGSQKQTFHLVYARSWKHDYPASRYRFNVELEGKTEEENQGFRKQLRENPESRPFLIDVHNYVTYLENPQPNSNSTAAKNPSLLIGFGKLGTRKLSWSSGGRDWSYKTIETNKSSPDSEMSYPLPNSNLELYKSGQKDPIKLYSNEPNSSRQLIKNLNVVNATDLINLYPFYVASCSEGGATECNLIEFSRCGKYHPKREFRLEEEIIQRDFSGSFVLVSKSANGSTLIFRTTVYNPQLLLKEVKLDGGKYLQQKFGYDYDRPSMSLEGGSFAFASRRVIPAANALKYGWMEYNNEDQNPNKAKQLPPKVFDNRGKFLRRLPTDNDDENDGDNESDENNKIASRKQAKEKLESHSIMSKVNGLPIVDVSPYSSSQCQIGYFGFQTYEKEKNHEDCSSWTFSQENVLSGEFPFTGQRILRLNGIDDTLKTEFPLEDLQDYKISTWIRTSARILEKGTSPILQAKIKDKKENKVESDILWTSKIVRREGDWFLLQINLIYNEIQEFSVLQRGLQKVNNGTNTTASSSSSNQSTAAPPEETKRVVEIIVRGLPGMSVDVDHVLFAPSLWDSDIFIFDQESFSPFGKIHSGTNLVSRYKFGALSTQMLAQVNEKGQVFEHQMKMKLKSGQNVISQPGLEATVRFEALGEPGWIENCDPSLTQSIKVSHLDSDRWSVSPGFIHHHDNSNLNRPGQKENSTIRFDFKDQSSFLLKFSYFFNSAEAPQKFVVHLRGVPILTADAVVQGTEISRVDLKFGSAVGGQSMSSPKRGIMTLALYDDFRVFVWMGEELIIDTIFNPDSVPPTSISSSSSNLPKFPWKSMVEIREIRGSLTFGDILILPRPKLSIAFTNQIKQSIQQLELVNKNSVKVTQTIYDEVGRSTAMTKPTIVTVSDAPLLEFRKYFVEHFRRLGSSTARMTMEGEVSSFNPEDLGFPFTSVEYENSSFLNKQLKEGRPGSTFAIDSRFQIHYEDSSPHVFISLLFPAHRGFQYKIKRTGLIRQSQSVYEEVTIYEIKKGAEVIRASAAITETGKNLLATYDYDNNGNLIANRSPEFHDRFKTILKGGKWDEMRRSPNFRKDIKEKLGDFGAFSILYKYDDKDRLVFKSSPDGGLTNYIYGDALNLQNQTLPFPSDAVQFVIHRTKDEPTLIDSILYYKYFDKTESGDQSKATLQEVGILQDHEKRVPASGKIEHVVTMRDSTTLKTLPKKIIQSQNENEVTGLFSTADIVVSRFGPISDFSLNSRNSTLTFDDHVESLRYEKSSNKRNKLPSARILVIPTAPNLPALLLPTSFHYTGAAGSDGERKLSRIQLPYRDYSIDHKYNLLGQLESISLISPTGTFSGQKKVEIVNYEYSAAGAVTRERYHGFKKRDVLDTQIRYNSPGYPIERKNQFMTESLSFEGSGYGDQSSGVPTSVMSIKTTSYWENPGARFYKDGSDFLHVGVPPAVARVCYAALVKLGYISQNEKVLKILQPKMESRLPVICADGAHSDKIHRVFIDKFSKTSGLSQGFKFQYGAHRELVKAKFVSFDDENPNENQSKNVGSVCSKPLTLLNLHEELNRHFNTSGQNSVMDSSQMEAIWNALLSSGFIIKNKENGRFSQVHGKPGKKIIDEKWQIKLLSIPNFPFPSPFLKQLLSRLADFVDKSLRQEDLEELLENFQPLLSREKRVENAGTMTEHLVRINLFSRGNSNSTLEVNSEIFSDQFQNLFSSDFITNSTSTPPTETPIRKKELTCLWQVLSSFFNCGLLTSPFDQEVLETDYNGNFRIMYKGQQRIELQYKNGSNLISSLKVTGADTQTSGKVASGEFQVTHDPFGSLNKATHRRIDMIVYDEVSARPIVMKMTNGLFLKFRYDHRGERVSKEVFSSSGVLLRRTNYLSRDEHGRSLIEEEFTFVSPDIPPKSRTTMYIYNPDRAKGLVGFVRNGKLYNVFTDNINSVRLVMLEGKVVAAFNYLPYGEVMTSYISSEDASIPYRFSGQELDEETGLYNFHARMYDPFLGRFYQMDPEEQFFSPYKYAGNSPLNAIDPDGRFIFTLIASICLAAVGAYVGAAAANGDWRPNRWKNDWNTWKGALFGALAGGLIIPTGGASLKALGVIGLGSTAAGFVVGGLGAVGAYSFIAGANKTWKFWKWDLTDPRTYNALFQGVAIGVALPAGISSYGAVFNGFASTTGQVLFVGLTVVPGVGLGYGAAAGANGGNLNFLEGDYADPNTLVSFVSTALGITLAGGGAYDSLKYVGKQGMTVFSTGFSNLAAAKTSGLALAKLGGVLGGAGLGGYVSVALKTDSWTLTSEQLKDPGTIVAILSGVWFGFLGKQTAKSVRETAKSIAKGGKSAIEFVKEFKREFREGLKAWKKTQRRQMTTDFEVTGPDGQRINGMDALDQILPPERPPASAQGALAAPGRRISAPVQTPGQEALAAPGRRISAPVQTPAQTPVQEAYARLTGQLPPAPIPAELATTFNFLPTVYPPTYKFAFAFISAATGPNLNPGVAASLNSNSATVGSISDDRSGVSTTQSPQALAQEALEGVGAIDYVSSHLGYGPDPTTTRTPMAPGVGAGRGKRSVVGTGRGQSHFTLPNSMMTNELKKIVTSSLTQGRFQIDSDSTSSQLISTHSLLQLMEKGMKRNLMREIISTLASKYQVDPEILAENFNGAIRRLSVLHLELNGSSPSDGQRQTNLLALMEKLIQLNTFEWDFDHSQSEMNSTELSFNPNPVSVLVKDPEIIQLLKNYQRDYSYFKNNVQGILDFVRQVVKDSQYKHDVATWDPTNSAKFVIQKTVAKLLQDFLQVECSRGGAETLKLFCNPTDLKFEVAYKVLMSDDEDESNRESQHKMILTDTWWQSEEHGGWVVKNQGAQSDYLSLFPPIGPQNLGQNESTQIQDQGISGRSKRSTIQLYDSDDNLVNETITQSTPPTASRLYSFHTSGSGSSRHPGIIHSLFKIMDSTFSQGFHLLATFFPGIPIPVQQSFDDVLDNHKSQESTTPTSTTRKEHDKSNKHDNRNNKKTNDCWPVSMAKMWNKEEDESFKFGRESFSSMALACSHSSGKILLLSKTTQDNIRRLPFVPNENSAPPPLSSSPPLSHDFLTKFARDDCNFLFNFEGKKAGFCEGPHSNILYLPNAINLPFDHLNDQLLLLILAQHFFNFWILKPFYSQLYSSENTGKESESDEMEFLLSEYEFIMFKNKFHLKLNKAKNLLEKLNYAKTIETKATRSIHMEFLRWSTFLMEDIQQDVEKEVEESNGSLRKSVKVSFMEQMDDLIEDLEEELFMFENRSEMNDEQNSNEKPESSVWPMTNPLQILSRLLSFALNK